VYVLLPRQNLKTHRDFQQQHCSALEPADSGVDHTVKYTHTYSNIHRIFDLIDFRDCVVTQTSVRVRTSLITYVFCISIISLK
jgi:hypothetical protein